MLEMKMVGHSGSSMTSCLELALCTGASCGNRVRACVSVKGNCSVTAQTCIQNSCVLLTVWGRTTYSCDGQVSTNVCPCVVYVVNIWLDWQCLNTKENLMRSRYRSAKRQQNRFVNYTVFLSSVYFENLVKILSCLCFSCKGRRTSDCGGHMPVFQGIRRTPRAIHVSRAIRFTSTSTDLLISYQPFYNKLFFMVFHLENGFWINWSQRVTSMCYFCYLYRHFSVYKTVQWFNLSVDRTVQAFSRVWR